MSGAQASGAAHLYHLPQWSHVAGRRAERDAGRRGALAKAAGVPEGSDEQSHGDEGGGEVSEVDGGHESGFRVECGSNDGVWFDVGPLTTESYRKVGGPGQKAARLSVLCLRAELAITFRKALGSGAYPRSMRSQCFVFFRVFPG